MGMDFTALMTQVILAKVRRERLSTSLADTAIQIAYRMGKTPHEVLRLAAENVGFTEDEWRSEIEPKLRQKIGRALGDRSRD